MAKVTTLQEALLVERLLGRRYRTALELESQLARYGLDVCIPGRQGVDKVLHREVSTYGTELDPADRCRVRVPDRTRQDQIPEYHFRTEYNDLERELPDGEPGRKMGDRYEFNSETGKFEPAK